MKEMMSNKLKNTGITILTAALMLSSTGCNKDFSEINTDPNRTTIAMPEMLLAPAIHAMVTANQSRGHRLNNELMQVTVTRSGAREFHRYVIRPNESDSQWNTWYVQLNNFRDIYKTAKKLNETGPYAGKYEGHMAIALVLESWAVSLITDMFGDIPYFDASLGKEGHYTAGFDRQKDIYLDLFEKLEEANELFARFAQTQQFTQQQAVLDPLYQGDVQKWRKFGNSLYLRLLLRASGKLESKATDKIWEMLDLSSAKYPLFESNDDSAVLRFTGTPPLVSAFYTWRDYDFNGISGASEFFVYNLNMWEDPRRPIWLTTSGGLYVGMPSAYPVGRVPDRESYIRTEMKDSPLLGNIMNYAELQFILAEIAVKGFANTYEAETCYNNGIRAGLEFWGAQMPADYLSRPTLVWLEAGDTHFKMQRIHSQKYYSMFFTDFQQWHEYRRTGYPILPQGEALENNRTMPTRFRYPVSVQRLNAESYSKAVQQMGGRDDMLTKVWWNTPDN